MRNVVAVILAAGKSTRMKSKKSKLLFRIKGKPVIKYVTDACQKAGVNDVILVVGFNAAEIQRTLGSEFRYALQTPQLGTGHALMKAKEQLLARYQGDILVMPGDAPFITPAIIRKLINTHRRHKSAATLLSAIFGAPSLLTRRDGAEAPPPPYGRIIRDKQGWVKRIVEERDATEAEKLIKEVSTSHYCFTAEKVLPLLSQITNHNAKQEYYLTDVIELLYKQGEKVCALSIKDPLALFGINTRDDLKLGKGIRRRLPRRRDTD